MRETVNAASSSSTKRSKLFVRSYNAPDVMLREPGKADLLLLVHPNTAS